MSAQPSPRSSVMQFLLILSVLYLGYFLFCGFPKSNDTRRADEVLSKMREQNVQMLDTTIATQLPVYTSKLQSEAPGAKLDQKEIDRRTIAATLLVADAQFRGGTYHDNYPKINRAYMTLQGLYNRFHETPLWNEPVTLPAVVEGRATEVVPSAFYAQVVTDLSKRNKDQRVVGFIPGYQFIDALVGLTGKQPGFSYWFAALILALCVRAIVWPLAQKQYMWGRRMSQLSPYLKEIQEKFKDKNTGRISPEKQQAMTQETMKLYKEYGMNPFAGCLPALVQMPLFLTVYYCMLLYKFDFQNGTFLWVGSDYSRFLGIPIAPNLGQTDYILVFLYGVSMIVTTLMTPVSDPTQVRQQRLIGLSIAVFFTIVMFFWPVPSAFVLYWIFTNLLTTVQAARAYRLPLPPLEKIQTVKGGMLPEGSGPNGRAVDIDPSFFGKTGTPKQNKPKRKK